MRKAKYIAISEQIEKAIIDGVYQEQLPGLYKLAEDYRTTHITISKALRLLEEKGMVTVNSTRGTFISAEGNFRKHRVVGVIGFNGHSEELEAIEDVANEFRYSVVALNPNTSFQKLLQDSPEFLLKFPADGYIFALSTLTNKLAAVLRGNGINFISLNQIIEPVGISWVDYNAEDNLLKMLNKIRTYGHERIAYVEFTNLHYSYSERIHKTYREFISSPPFSEEYFFSPGTQDEYFRRYGFDYYRQMAKDSVEWLLSLKQIPTAVIAFEDRITGFMIEYLQKFGISVPEDMSIVTYFDNQSNEHLAGLCLDPVKRAKLASRILFDQIKYQKHSVIQKFIDSKFIEGPSLARVPADKITMSTNILNEVF